MASIRRIAAIFVAVGLISSFAMTGSAGASPYAFNKPVAIAVNGSNLWIANSAGNSLTETTLGGAWVRTISGAQYGFHNPVAIVSYGADLFVVNKLGSVTELNAGTTALVRIISGAAYHFGTPTTAIQQGGHIWVANTGTSTLTEFSASTGAFIRNLSDTNTHYGFKTPNAIAVAGTNLWITSRTGGSTTDANAGAVTEIVAATGAFVRRVVAVADGLERPSGIAFDGARLWISDAATNAVTELNAAGTLLRVVGNSSLDQDYGFDAPTVVVANAPYVYVVSPPGASPMVTEITTATAEGNWYECNTNTPDPDFANPTGLAVHGDSIWVVSPGDDTLTQLSHAAGGNRVHIFT